MANDIPHIPDAQEPEDHLAPGASESGWLPATTPLMDMPISDQQSAPPRSADPVQARPANANPAQANPSNANPDEPVPPPSRSNAAWLVITLMNIVLIVFLVPASLLKQDQLGFIFKVVSIVGAMGAFAAGLVWFKNLMTSLPQQRWFKIANVAILFAVVPLHVSQQSVVPLHPRIEPSGTLLEIDGQQRDYEGGVRLSVSNHQVRVRATSNSHPRDIAITYKDVFYAIFKNYSEYWTPWYKVTINTNSENVEVLIRKKDGEFDADFRKHPPATELALPFQPKSNSNDTFIYHGANNPNGSADHINLPYGEYELTARSNGCNQTLVTQLIVGKVIVGKVEASDRVDFDPLCDTP